MFKHWRYFTFSGIRDSSLDRTREESEMFMLQKHKKTLSSCLSNLSLGLIFKVCLDLKEPGKSNLSQAIAWWSTRKKMNLRGFPADRCLCAFLWSMFIYKSLSWTRLPSTLLCLLASAPTEITTDTWLLVRAECSLCHCACSLSESPRVVILMSCQARFSHSGCSSKQNRQWSLPCAALILRGTVNIMSNLWPVQCVRRLKWSVLLKKKCVSGVGLCPVIILSWVVRAGCV